MSEHPTAALHREDDEVFFEGDIEEKKVAFVKVIEESEATGKVKETYEEIKKTLGIDFIPKM